jgi:hypothetical protein
MEIMIGKSRITGGIGALSRAVAQSISTLYLVFGNTPLQYKP